MKIKKIKYIKKYYNDALKYSVCTYLLQYRFHMRWWTNIFNKTYKVSGVPFLEQYNQWYHLKEKNCDHIYRVDIIDQRSPWNTDSMNPPLRHSGAPWEPGG